MNSLIVAIGVSAGGTEALRAILPRLPASFMTALVVVQHLHPDQDVRHFEYLERECALPLREATEKMPALPGVVYFAPANYHLLMEADGTFSLSDDEKVNYSRPSIDVLFESVADTYGPRSIGVILTGANADGAQGLRAIWERGGVAIVQDSRGAAYPCMPAAALEKTPEAFVTPLDRIAEFLVQLTVGGERELTA